MQIILNLPQIKGGWKRPYFKELLKYKINEMTLLEFDDLTSSCVEFYFTNEELHEVWAGLSRDCFQVISDLPLDLVIQPHILEVHSTFMLLSPKESTCRAKRLSSQCTGTGRYLRSPVRRSLQRWR